MPPSTPSSSDASRAEKRVLWEMRQRYKLQPPARPLAHSAPPASPPKNPPSTPAPKPAPRKPKRRFHWGRMIILIILALGLVGGIAFSYKILAAGNKITVANRSIFGQLKDLLLSSDQKLHGESDGRINILLLAIGGEGHSGENLTDTIMVASIRPSDHSVALLSIPRDLYVKVPGENFYSKLNAVHAYGEAKQHDLGPVLIKQKVEEITGLPIHYFARVDFTAFKSLVDAVGGIHITIPTTFFDYWHKISFPAGTEDMNGDRALAYVRARYIEGPEGGDFKRAGRQQQVLLAIRDKIFSVSTALDFTKLNKILDSLSNNVRTDMQLWEIKRFYEMARQIDTSKIKSVVLSNARDGVLVSSTEILGGQPAYILKTRTGDYSEIQAIAKNIFSPDVGSSLAPSAGDAGTTPPPPADAGDIAPLVSDTPTPSPSASPAAAVTTTVEVRNGTTITGLAKKTADTLQAKGYTITGTGNAKQRNATATTVYAVSQDHQAQASAISQLLNATLDTKLPTGESASKADVVVILGSDAK